MPQVPKQLLKGGSEFRIVWQDGHESKYTYRALRQACPCAVCRDEFTGRQILDPQTVPQDIGAQRAELVGNYAISFQFSDGHSTGIYSFESLRGLCACGACALRPAA